MKNYPTGDHPRWGNFVLIIKMIKRQKQAVIARKISITIPRKEKVAACAIRKIINISIMGF